MDCNLHLLPLKSDVMTSRNQDGGGDAEGSNSNMSTGSDYSPAPTVLANDSNDKIGKIKVTNDLWKGVKWVGANKFSCFGRYLSLPVFLSFFHLFHFLSVQPDRKKDEEKENEAAST